LKYSLGVWEKCIANWEKNAKFCEGKPPYIGGISKQKKKNHWPRRSKHSLSTDHINIKKIKHFYLMISIARLYSKVRLKEARLFLF
jgi:hypothetical protein